jgi:DNA helicase HerA-like ATPase
VGIFFVTQNPQDVPDAVLGQLGNRVQHALRAFTPNDAAALQQAVRTYPRTTDYDLSAALQQLGTGEAVVTVLSEAGAPTPVAWVRMRPPRSLMAQLDAAEQQQAVGSSQLQAKYGQAVDRDSAYERLTARLAPPAAPAAKAQVKDARRGPAGKAAHKAAGRKPASRRHRAPAPEETSNPAMSALGRMLGSKTFQSFARSAATTIGREITRDVMGTRRR